jgi:hypothetical protein
LSKYKVISREESLKMRARQILNLRYSIRQDIENLYRRRANIYHPDKPEGSTKKMQLLNQAHDILLDKNPDLEKYKMLENTKLVQSLLPAGIKPTPLGKTYIEIWKERYGEMI